MLIQLVMMSSFVLAAETPSAPTVSIGCASDVYVTPPDPKTMALIRLGLTADGYALARNRMKRDSQGARARVLAVPDDQRTFANTIRAMDEALAEMRRYAFAISPTNALGAEPKNKAAKAAREAAYASFRRALTEEESAWMLSADLQRAVQLARTESPREEETKALYLREFAHSGADLPEGSRDQLAQFKLKISGLMTEVLKEFKDTSRYIEVPVADAPGLDADFIKRLTKDDPRVLRISANSAKDVSDFLSACTNPKARRRVYEQFRQRVPDNAERLLNMVRTRTAMAQLRKKSFMDLAIDEHTVSGSAAAAEELLLDLAAAMKPLIQERVQQIAAMKVADGDTTPVGPWDFFHYEDKIHAQAEQPLSFRVEDYFHPETLQPNAYAYLGRIGSLQLEEMKVSGVWDPSVRLVLVRDLARGGVPLGHMLLDVYRREGKNPNIAYVSALNSYRPARDGRPAQLPLVLIVFNWDRPQAGERSAGLTVEEVKTVLHENGHALHGLFSTADSELQGPFAHAMDFVEAPSTGLDATISDPKVLIALSEHIDHPGLKLTEAQALELTRPVPFSLTSKEYMSTTHLLNTVFLSILDLRIHQQIASLNSREDLNALYRKEFIAFYGVDPGPGDTFPETFQHIFSGGYASNYSAYVRAKWISANTLERLHQLGGPTSPVAYGRYVNELLREPVRTTSIRQKIEAFLEAPLRVAPLLRLLGLPVSAEVAAKDAATTEKWMRARR